jgi:hypothetical protein
MDSKNDFLGWIDQKKHSFNLIWVGYQGVETLVNNQRVDIFKRLQKTNEARSDGVDVVQALAHN